jgi:hypothetical protein
MGGRSPTAAVGDYVDLGARAREIARGSGGAATSRPRRSNNDYYSGAVWPDGAPVQHVLGAIVTPAGHDVEIWRDDPAL